MRIILQFYDNDELKIIDDIEKVPRLLYNRDAAIPYNYYGHEFEEFKDPLYVDKLKKRISQIESLFPLFDIYSRNTYLVDRDNIYYFVINKHYRRIDRKLYKTLVRNIEKYSKEQYFYFQDILENLKKGIQFIRNYDFDELKKTYIKIIKSLNIPENKLKEEFYVLTSCIRHSFLPYILTSNPYYTKSELENLGKNMKLEIEDVDDICTKVRKNDVKSWLIMEHQNYIDNNENKYLIEYYSFYGAYYINEYLRGISHECSQLYVNKNLELQIKNLNNLIIKAPKLDRKYIIYRFLKDDNHLKDLKEGETYTSNSFMSCTRNPFYEAKDHVFGYILLKIEVPEGIRGVCLFMETYSLFKQEQEIIIAPNSRFTVTKIERGEGKTLYYHTNKKYKEMIEKIYELKYEGTDEFKININYPMSSKSKLVDFTKLNLSIDEFTKIYLNELYYLSTKFNQSIYKFKCCWYDSTGSYKKYFFLNTNKSLYMYNQSNNGKLNLLIELDEIMSVNYYHKYSENNMTMFSDSKLIPFLIDIAKCFNIHEIYIHPNYKSCKDLLIKYGSKDKDIFKFASDITNYNVDIFEYLKFGRKRFGNIKEIEHNINYKYFDKLETIEPMSILSKEDKDLICRIYRKIFKNTKRKDNLKEFYLFMLENYYYEVHILEKKINKKYNKDIFSDIYYKLDVYQYLYNRNKIKEIPTKPIYKKNLLDKKTNNNNIMRDRS
jgi:hypothetical protein